MGGALREGGRGWGVGKGKIREPSVLVSLAASPPRAGRELGRFIKLFFVYLL
ncbi:MAG: hypothetical protein V1889_01450 [archaeon]